MRLRGMSDNIMSLTSDEQLRHDLVHMVHETRGYTKSEQTTKVAEAYFQYIKSGKTEDNND